MTKNVTIKKPFSGEHAAQYDQRAGQAGWLDPDVLFGLAFRHVYPGETLLDVGIGTGLASVLFHKAGLKVIGLDRSSEMLAICRQKGFAAELLEQDVAVPPYPLADGAVDHAVCSGLLHAFADLSLIFGEVGRVVKKDGVFAFVVPRSDAGKVEEWRVEGRDGYPSAILYRHSLSSIAGLVDCAGFELVQSLRFTASVIGRREGHFLACLAQKR